MKIYEAAELLQKGKMSPSELAEDVLSKIKEKESMVNAYITLCDDVLDRAKAAEKRKTQSPLWGIPVAVKDNICTKGIRTTAGSRMLENFIPPYDATVVEALKASGAIITGKTNMDEFGMGSDSKYSAFKITANPIDYDFVPGGSSGGSAAAVKAGMALGALGSDTGGSVRQPASFCGIYALKPTYSLVSRYGLIAFASGLDCIGPMGTCVRDIAIMTDAIAMADMKDATCSSRERESYYKNLDGNVKNLKIGLPKELFDIADEGIKNAVYKAAQRLEDMGAVIEECSVETAKYAVSAYYMISSAEASSNLARYDSVRFGHRAEEYENYADMCAKSRSEAFGEEVKRRILLGTHILSAENYGTYYKKAKAAQGMIRRELDALFEKYDILLTPTSPCKVPKRDEKGTVEKRYEKDVCTALVSLAGVCAMSVPCGSDDNGMPIGMQLISGRFKEAVLFNAALAYEEGGEGNV